MPVQIGIAEWTCFPFLSNCGWIFLTVVSRQKFAFKIQCEKELQTNSLTKPVKCKSYTAQLLKFYYNFMSIKWSPTTNRLRDNSHLEFKDQFSKGSDSYFFRYLIIGFDKKKSSLSPTEHSFRLQLYKIVSNKSCFCSLLASRVSTITNDNDILLLYSADQSFFRRHV